MGRGGGGSKVTVGGRGSRVVISMMTSEQQDGPT